MENKRILFSICDPLCDHAAVLKQLTTLCKHSDMTAAVSENVYTCPTYFFDKGVFMGKVKDMVERDIIHTIVEAKKVGPADVYDTMVITPMIATVAAEMVCGIYDRPVTLFTKAIIRSQRNIVFGIATSDGLGISGVNIPSLINMKHFYITPFRQDAPFSKE